MERSWKLAKTGQPGPLTDWPVLRFSMTDLLISGPVLTEARVRVEVLNKILTDVLAGGEVDRAHRDRVDDSLT